MSGEVNPELKQQVHNQLNKVFEWRELEDGLNTVYQLTSRDAVYILKERTNPENQITWFKAEPRIYEAISKNTDVPSPEIIYEDFSTENYRNAFYVMEKMPGKNPQKMKDQLNQQDFEEIILQYGKILGKLHKVQVSDKYGIQGFEDGKFTSSEPNDKWSESIEGAMSAWKDKIEENWGEPPEVKYNSEKVKQVLPDKHEPVFVHDDNRLDNILLKGSEITGFIDWSTSWTGHKHYDMVRAKYLLIEWDLHFWDRQFNEDKLEEKLYEGYKNEAELKRDERYRVNEQIYRYASTLWLAAGFANWGQNLKPEEYEEMRQEITTRLKQEQKRLTEQL